MSGRLAPGRRAGTSTCARADSMIAAACCVVHVHLAAIARRARYNRTSRPFQAPAVRYQVNRASPSGVDWSASPRPPAHKPAKNGGRDRRRLSRTSAHDGSLGLGFAVGLPAVTRLPRHHSLPKNGRPQNQVLGSFQSLEPVKLQGVQFWHLLGLWNRVHFWHLLQAGRKSAWGLCRFGVALVQRR